MKRRAHDRDLTLAALENGERELPGQTPSDGRLVVWALRQLAFHYIDDAWRRKKFQPTLDVVEAPFDGNPNLRAQRGLFTLVAITHRGSRMTTCSRPSRS
jgi:hypothetical protein